MEEERPEALKVDLCVSNGSWHVVVEQEGQRRELGARARAFMIQEKHWRSQCRKLKDYLEGLC